MVVYIVHGDSRRWSVDEEQPRSFTVVEARTGWNLQMKLPESLNSRTQENDKTIRSERIFSRVLNIFSLTEEKETFLASGDLTEDKENDGGTVDSKTSITAMVVFG